MHNIGRGLNHADVSIGCADLLRTSFFWLSRILKKKFYEQVVMSKSPERAEFYCLG